MLIYDLVLEYKDKFEEIKDRYETLYPLYEDYELEAYLNKYGKEWVDNEYDNHFKRLNKKFSVILETKPQKTENIIFALELKSELFNDNYKKTYIHIFMCNKKEIYEVMDKHFGMWNNDLESILSHYSYEGEAIEDLVGTEIFCSENIDKKDVLCTILNEFFRLGITEEEKKTVSEHMLKEVDMGIEDLNKGRFLLHEEVIASLRQVILDHCKTDEERQRTIEHYEEVDKNEPRDRLYICLVSKINHKECIKIVEEWCVNEILAGRINGPIDEE